MSGKVEVVKLLLNRPDVNEHDLNKLLIKAVDYDSLTIVELLLSHPKINLRFLNEVSWKET